ncbi:FAD-dependent oxidoreductase [Streptomyces sp. NPDC058818]|uniref:FAD-dependent oxidoreductase n=1 Tax=Streptomyces sp. NPDC058818 TaxID=3346640 RepID=UPI0036B5FF59
MLRLITTQRYRSRIRQLLRSSAKYKSRSQPGTVPVGTWEGAEIARVELTKLAPSRTVTVIGTGPTGIETAAEDAFARPDLCVRLVGQRLAPSLHERTRARVRAGLERLGVSVLEDSVVDVLSREGERGIGILRLRSGAQLGSELTLWAVLGSIPDLAGRSGLRVDDQGRAVVDPYLRSTTDPRILVVGDCAAVPGSRAACQTAVPQGAHAADTLERMVRNQPLKPYSFGYVGTGLTLGRRDGVVQVSRRDDRARRLYLAGRTAAAVKEGATRFAKYGSRTATVTWLPGPESVVG